MILKPLGKYDLKISEDIRIKVLKKASTHSFQLPCVRGEWRGHNTISVRVRIRI